MSRYVKKQRVLAKMDQLKRMEELAESLCEETPVFAKSVLRTFHK